LVRFLASLVRYLASLVYGISVYDAVSLAAVPFAVVVVAALACLAPALWAARTDPVETLRG
jgi:ABC-type lipoprotein release transport system permease subunit